MTKETIIDGVDVAGCEFHSNLIMDCTLMPLQNLACEKCPNCYYKQLQRVKAENEKLKTERNRFKKKYRKNRLDKQKYRHILEEIKENIQNWINSPWSCFNCRNNMDERLTEIKNKINEVQND